MKVSVINQQNAIRVETPAIRKLAEFFLNKASRRAHLQWGDISLVLVDDNASRTINRNHLNHDYATDVISFNFAPIPGDASGERCGEIIVNAEQAGRLGSRFGGVDRELALYIAHGIDHLSGANDKTPAQRRRMRRRELRWIREAFSHDH